MCPRGLVRAWPPCSTGCTTPCAIVPRLPGSYRGNARQTRFDRRAVLELTLATPPEIIADAIAMTTRALREVVGEVGVEDYLDEVFSSFCIGK